MPGGVRPPGLIRWLGSRPGHSEPGQIPRLRFAPPRAGSAARWLRAGFALPCPSGNPPHRSSYALSFDPLPSASLILRTFVRPPRGRNMRYLLPRDSLALIPRGTGVPFKACFDPLRGSLRWLRCAGYATLAPLRWLRYAGSAALATLRASEPSCLSCSSCSSCTSCSSCPSCFRLATRGSAALASPGLGVAGRLMSGWLRPVGLTPTGRNGSSAAPTGSTGGRWPPSGGGSRDRSGSRPCRP